MSGPSQPPKRRKTVLTIKQKLDTIDRLEKGESVHKLAKELGIGVSTVRDFKKQKEKLIKFARDCNGGEAAITRKSLKKSSYENLDACMIQWVNQQRSEGIPISGPMCMEKALFFHHALGIEGTFNASSGWLTRFKNRYGIREACMKGEKTSASYSAAESFVNEFCDYVEKEELSLDQIFNADEAGIYWKCLPNQMRAMQQEKEIPGFTSAKERVTVMCCANASGTFRLKPLVIGKTKNPRSFGKNFEKKLPVHYEAHPSAWMDGDLFTKWFNEIFVPQVSEWLEKSGLPKKAVLLLDSAPCHPTDLCSTNEEIVLKFIPPNVKSLIQPMDQGIISSMKRIYRKNLLRFFLLEDDKLRSSWKKIKLVNAVNLIAEAWKEVKNLILIHGWKKMIPGIVKIEASADEEVTASDLVQIISGVRGFENISEANMEEWLEYDKDDEGYKILSDQEILDSVTQGEPVEEQEEGGDGECETAMVSHGEALECVEKLLYYVSQQTDFSFNDIIALHNIRQIVLANQEI